ncbi:ABC transporter ATP-binding protein [Fusibacter sp. JL298sf-3]
MIEVSKKDVALAIVMLLASVLLGIVPFVLSYQLIVPLITGGALSFQFVAVRTLGVLLCLTLQPALYGAGLDRSHTAAYTALMHLRIALQRRLEQLPLGVIQEKGNGRIKKLLVDDVDSMELLLAHSLPEGVANLMVPVAVYTAMFWVDWRLALMSLASLPISLIAMAIMYGVGTRQMDAYYQSAQTMNNTIIEYINGMEVVRVFNKDGESYARFKDHVYAYRDYTLKWYKACWPWMSIFNSVLPCTIVLTLPLGAWSVLKGFSTLPDFILVICLSLSIGPALLKVMSFLPVLPQLKYKLGALEAVLEAPPLKQSPRDFEGVDYTVVFENVGFAYEDVAVLERVNITAKAGEKTALVGESGSGKSTLAKLLVHYYDVLEGRITIGGQDIADMSLEALNRQIAFVAQEQYLFNMTLMENIRVGKPEATDDEVREAAEKAQCLSFIEALPHGFQTLAGEAGKQLSGGQRQRIALARAILKDAPIVVLDEATAFVDPENEEKIEQALNALVAGKTLIVIAHRLSSIQNADNICVMQSGAVAAQGTHDALLASCPEYVKLWRAYTGSTQWRVELEKECG